MNKINETVAFIKSKFNKSFELGIILGSGLGDLVDEIQDKVEIPYEDIVHFPVSTAPGHGGKLVLGSYQGKTIMCMQGRFHYYEGYDMKEVTYPVRVMQALGIETLIITNASGSLNVEYQPGDLVVIDDHINMMGANPLIGANMDEFGPRFVDMSEPYDKELIALAHDAADRLDIELKQGTYVSYSGPNFETAAEVRLFGEFGGAVVGMSTVPEVLVANHGGQRVLTISCATNLGTGLSQSQLSGEEVLEVSKSISKKFIKLMSEIIKDI